MLLGLSTMPWELPVGVWTLWSPALSRVSGLADGSNVNGGLRPLCVSLNVFRGGRSFPVYPLKSVGDEVPWDSDIVLSSHPMFSPPPSGPAQEVSSYCYYSSCQCVCCCVYVISVTLFMVYK